MNRQEILNDLKKHVEDYAEVEYSDYYACWTAHSQVYYGDNYFSVWWYADDANDAEVRGLIEVDEIFNNKNQYKVCENIAQWLEENLCEWSEIEKEHEDDMRPYDYWDEHGFRNAQDYYHYRYGN